MALRAPFQPEAVGSAEFNPLMVQLLYHQWGVSPTPVDGWLSRHQQRGSAPGFAAWKYVRPVGRLMHRVRIPGCGEPQYADIPSAAGEASFSPGSMVSIGTLRSGSVVLGRPPGGLLGVSGFSVDQLLDGAFDDVGITSIEGEVNPGESDVELTVSGFGFSEAPLDVFDAVLYDGDEESGTFGTYSADPYVTLHDPTWVSQYEVTILADALSNTPAIAPTLTNPAGYPYPVMVRVRRA